MIDFEKLIAPFPVEQVLWRVGATTQDKTKGMALAYVDARVVMDRLDAVCGPEGWQCKYSHATGKTICDIGIKVMDGEWVWKADGAGDSDVEADKGALSDAFKRAAVRWGIGRYLYNIDSPWVQIAAFPSGRGYKIADSEIERLYQCLPNGTGGLKVLEPAGLSKTPAKFWGTQDYNILCKLPAALKNPHGDPEWNDPETLAKLCELMPQFINKAPTATHLVKLQVDNLRWMNEYLPKEDAAQINEGFVIRAKQFEQSNGGKNDSGR